MSVVSSVSSCGALRIAPWRPPKAPEMKAQKAKNSKMEVVPALINSLYGRLRKRTIFGNLRGGPHELASKKAKMTELSTFSSISYCGTIRFAPWRAAFPW